MNDTMNKEIKLTITLQGKEGAIGIRKNVYRAMGCPQYVSLRISYKHNSLMLLPCESKDVMSYAVPEQYKKNSNKSNFRIHSLSFVKSVLLDNGLDIESTYVLEGTKVKDTDAITFSIENAILLEESMVCSE